MALAHRLTIENLPSAVPPNEASVFFIGNATILLRIAGFTILTDPTFIHKHEKTWLGHGLETTRLVDPAMELADLPPIDFVLLSHFHGDQLVERDLDKTLPIITIRQAADDLTERGFMNCYPLDVWDAMEVAKGDGRITITATPAKHGPPIVDFFLPDVMGSILDVTTPNGGAIRLYITGDTLVIDELKEIPERFPGIDIGFFHLGGTRVLGVLVSMDARQGLEALRIIDPALAIPIHYDDYDVFTSPLSDFQDAVRAAGLEDRVHYLYHGDTYRFGVG